MAQNWFSRFAAAFAILLGLIAIWIVVPELLRARQPRTMPTGENVTALSNQPSAADWAPALAVVRGDLWAEYALTFSDLVRDEAWNAADLGAPVSTGQPIAAAERALALAPHNSRVWLLLLLAGIQSRLDVLTHKATAALRMSYYTGSNERALSRLRLFVAIRSNALADAELQQLVSREIRTIITHRPDLKPAIVAAYRDALPEGRNFIEATLEDIDQKLRGSLRAGGPL